MKLERTSTNYWPLQVKKSRDFRHSWIQGLKQYRQESFLFCLCFPLYQLHSQAEGPQVVGEMPLAFSDLTSCQLRKGLCSNETPCGGPKVNQTRERGAVAEVGVVPSAHCPFSPDLAVASDRALETTAAVPASLSPQRSTCLFWLPLLMTLQTLPPPPQPP